MLFSIVLIAFVLLWVWSLMVDPKDEAMPYRPPTLEYEVERIPKLKNMFTYLGNYTLTAYCPCSKCSGDYGNLTATGTTAKQGYTVAVDPKKIPYGSLLYIEGLGYRFAEDTGGAIKGEKIDIYFDSHQEALNFGVQKQRVFLLIK